MSDMSLIVGLGNPGAKYEQTRHNIGYMAVDALARKHGLSFGKQEHRALVASGTILGKRVLLAKPLTYMNASGDAVQPLVHFYKIDLPNLLIVQDDLDTPLGTIRMRKAGSSGGQNGMKHILQRLGTQEVNRLRLGISRPPGRMDPMAWVLSAFKGDDAILAAQVVDRAVEAVELWLTSGVELAMSRFNMNIAEPPKPERPKPPRANPEPVKEDGE
jgi:PTH1 family peptidyl-tRNA hydrolase